jgi:pimeloyl-ACP methyl ester carboxylesterase
VKYLTSSGVEIAYLDEGKGPTVVLGHCSSASHKEWLPLIEALKTDWRVLAPDFIGYGISGLWPADAPFKSEADLDVLTAVAKKTKGPLHLVGHSYGAALALEAARQLGSRVKSLVLVEPVSFHLLRQEDRPEWTEIEQLGKAVLGAVAKGDDRTAAAAFMSYWLGRWRWRLSRRPSPGRARIRHHYRRANHAQRVCRDRHPGFVHQTRQDARADPRRGRSPGRETLPNAKVATLEGAGHMSPFTHPSELNQMILDYLAAQR